MREYIFLAIEFSSCAGPRETTLHATVRHEDHFPYSYYTNSRTPSHARHTRTRARIMPHAYTGLHRGKRRKEEDLRGRE